MRYRTWPWLGIVGLAVIWRTIYAYWTPIIDRYLVPPGDDPAFHLAQIDRILHGQVSLVRAGYPMGFHLLAAGLARLFGLDPLSAIRLIPPSLLIIPVGVIFVVGWRLFRSPAAGAIAAAAWAFLALAPIRSFGDGNYPDLLADSVFLPWAMLALYEFCQSRSIRRLINLLIPVCLILLTHHLTFIQFLLISLPISFWTLGGRLKDPTSRKPTMYKLLAGLGLIVITAFLAWPAYGPTLLVPYIAALRVSGSLATILRPYSTPPNLATILQIHNPTFIILGVIGLFVFWWLERELPVKIFLLGWIGVLVVLSVTPVFGLPGRFVRELALPLALLVGYFPVALASRFPSRTAWIILAVVITAVFAIDWAASFHRPYALPDPFGPLIRVQHDEEAGIALLDRLTPAGGTILANNSDPYLVYLVHHPVVTVNNPQDVAQVIALQPIAIVYVGARPPLTPANVYPYFQNFTATAAALRQIPGLVPIASLPSGTRLYRSATQD